jgi:dihydroorotate dehydrogenase (fumarate)
VSAKLKTRYLGLDLASPVVASASPITDDVHVMARLEEAGAGAVVMPSLFEEQIEHEELSVARLQDFGSHGYAEAMDYFPELDTYNTGPDRYLKRIEEAKRQVSIPVIASLNGATPGGWVHYAGLMQQAGADALELNVYFLPTDPKMSGSDVVQRYVDLVTAVREAVTIPLAVKVAHGFSAPLSMGLRLIEAGANGLVLFNRYLRPDLDLETMQLVPRLVLSTPEEVRRSLLWIGILRDHTDASLAGSTGVHSWREAMKLLLVGADVAMTTSALLDRGPDYLREILHGIETFMDEREYESVDQLRGSMSRANCPDPSAYERANYMRALTEWSGRPI